MTFASVSQFHVYLPLGVLNAKAVVAAFIQEKALVGAFSVITNLRMELFEALPPTQVIGPPWPRRLMRVFLYRDNAML